MKRYLSILGLSSLVVLAFTAMSAASASASQPLFKSAAGFPVTFTGSGGFGKLETVAGRLIECESSTDSGEIINETEAKNIHVAFKGCTATFGSLIKVSCSNTKNEGEITTVTQHGHLQYGKFEKEPGVFEQDPEMLLTPESGEVFAEFACASGTVKLTVKGAVMGQVSPKNTKTSKITITFKMSSKGVQNPLEEYNPVGCALERRTLETKGEGVEGFPYEQSAVEGSAENSLSAEGTIESTSCV